MLTVSMSKSEGRVSMQGELTPVRVFESVPGPGPIVKFIDEIVLHAPDDIRFRFFSWRTALVGDYDVFHVHWPEFLIRDRSPLKAAVKRALFRMLLARLRRRGTPVVRTVHNVEPHEPGASREAVLLDRLASLHRTEVVMSSCTPVSAAADTVLIPHGDFRESFAGRPRQQLVRGRVLLFGRIQPYKGVLELIRAAEEITDPEVELRVVGAPTPEMRALIEAELSRKRRGARVSVDLRVVSDDEMIAEVTGAELIALPYRDAGNGNSGVAMLSLSLDRPVLTPRGCLMEELAEETGPGWVELMDGEISGARIQDALARIRERPAGASPNLVGRDWPAVADAYATVFRAAASRPRADETRNPS